MSEAEIEDDPAPHHVEDESHWRDDPIDFNPCDGCDAMCCSFERGRISFISLEKGQRYDSAVLEYEHIEDLLLGDGSPMGARWFVITHPSGDRHLSFDCEHVTDDGRCGVYAKRPGMCRRFECGAFGEDSAEEAAEYLEGEMVRDEGELERLEWREVTDRVRAIIDRRADEEGLR